MTENNSKAAVPQPKPRGTGAFIQELMKEDTLTEDFLWPEQGLKTVELWARSIVLYLTMRTEPALAGLAEFGKMPKGDPAIAQQIIRDITAREELGRQKYGEALRANNGRDALVDARQEAHDLWAYLRQNREEKAIRD